jgi:hypothetical protein
MYVRSPRRVRHEAICQTIIATARIPYGHYASYVCLCLLRAGLYIRRGVFRGSALGNERDAWNRCESLKMRPHPRSSFDSLPVYSFRTQTVHQRPASNRQLSAAAVSDIVPAALMSNVARITLNPSIADTRSSLTIRRRSVFIMSPGRCLSVCQSICLTVRQSVALVRLWQAAPDLLTCRFNNGLFDTFLAFTRPDCHVALGPTHTRV